VDPRWELSLRLFAPRDADLPLSGLPLLAASSPELYHYLRVLNSIYEGTQELPVEKALPLEANLQHNVGLHFQKGCYLGQELVARTFHKGELHKALFTLRMVAPGISSDRIWQSRRDRLFPENFLNDAVLAEDDGRGRGEFYDSATDAAHFVAQNGKTSGRIFGRILDLAVGHVRFEHMVSPHSSFEMRDANLRGISGSEVRWRIIYPPWWDQTAH
jgi:folate-binding protein YgfZ